MNFANLKIHWIIPDWNVRALVTGSEKIFFDLIKFSHNFIRIGKREIAENEFGYLFLSAT